MKEPWETTPRAVSSPWSSGRTGYWERQKPMQWNLNRSLHYWHGPRDSWPRSVTEIFNADFYFVSFEVSKLFASVLTGKYLFTALTASAVQLERVQSGVLLFHLEFNSQESSAEQQQSDAGQQRRKPRGPSCVRHRCEYGTRLNLFSKSEPRNLWRPRNESWYCVRVIWEFDINLVCDLRGKRRIVIQMTRSHETLISGLFPAASREAARSALLTNGAISGRFLAVS